MATLFNTKIKDTYQSLLKLEDNTILTTTVKNVTDGLGNASPLYMSTTRIGIGTNAPTVALEINGHFVQNASGYGIATNTILNTTIDYYQYGGHQFRSWGASGAQTVMRITGSGTDGKVLIGTTTDAGYKLDVNGTARLGANNGYVTVTSYTPGATTMTVANVGHHSATAISASSAVGINAISILGAGPSTTLGVGVAARRAVSPLVDSFTDADGVVNSTYKPIGLYAERAFISTSGYAFNMTNGTMLHVDGATLMSGSVTANTIPATPNTAYGLNIKNTLVAAANNDSLVSLDINPTFTNGAFTGVNNYNIRTRGLLNKMYFQSPTTNQGRHDISFGFGGNGEQVKLIALAQGASGQGNLYIASASGDSAVATTSDANALFGTNGNTFYKTFNLDQSSASSGFGITLSGNQNNSTPNGIFFRFSESRVAILSKPHGSSGYADFRIAVVPVGGANNPPQESDTKFMITKDTTNVLINTTTDAGYKLDVNGSTRVKGNTLTVSASGLSSPPANYVGINFDDNPNHHEYWFAINSKKDLYGAIGIGYDRIIFPTMGNDNSTWEFNALGSYSRIKIAARNNTAGNFLDLNNSSISFCGSWTIASIDRTNRKLVFGNMSTDVHHIGVYDLVIKGAQPFEGNAGGSIANGGNVYVVGGTPSTSPTGNYGNVILAHDGTAARGNVLIGTTTDSGFKLDVNGTARVNGVLTVGSSTITGNFGAMSLNNNGVAGVSLSFTNSSFGSNNPCVLGDQGNHAHSSSQVEIRSTAKGFLPPRMTSTQRNAISSPATGLQVYDTTQNAICEYTGTAWRTISGGKQILTATTGATTVDLSLGNVTDVTLTLSTVITLSNPTVGTYVIKLIQDSIGGKTVSWPFNVLWSGSTPPTLTATANKTDVITLVYDGVNYYGTYALNF